MVEFSCEAVWFWAFVCWNISDYSFNFCACDGSVKIFYFFLVQFGKFIFLRICQFLPCCPFYWHTVADSSLLWCFSVLSIVISSFSFLILLIWFFSLCFLMSLANGFSILFILSKNQLLALFFFFYGLVYFFFWIYLCPNFYLFFPYTNPGVLHFFLFLLC